MSGTLSAKVGTGAKQKQNRDQKHGDRESGKQIRREKWTIRAERQTDEQTMSGILSKLEMGAKAEQNRDQKKTGKNHKHS